MSTHIVTATRLNFRNSPEQASSNRIGVLDQDTPVAVLTEEVRPGWSKIQVELQGNSVEGFVASRFLAPLGLRLSQHRQPVNCHLPICRKIMLRLLVSAMAGAPIRWESPGALDSQAAAPQKWRET